MSKQANPVIIGVFVLGGSVLAIIVMLLLGSNELYKKKRDFVMYFEGSVNGLNVGAPVNLRGVQVGKVKKISLINDYSKGEIHIPVIAEYYPENVITLGEELESEKDNVRRLVEMFGLRAQLQTQSMLTGQLFVQLDYHPNSPYKYHGDGELIEVPIIPSSLEVLEKKFTGLDFASLTHDISHVSTAVAEVAKNPKLKQSVDNLEQALLATRQTMMATTKLVNIIDARVIPISEKIQRLLDNLQASFTKLDKVIANIDELSNEDSPTIYKLHTALDELTNTSKSIREFADTLEHHPEALIKGRKSQ